MDSTKRKQAYPYLAFQLTSPKRPTVATLMPQGKHDENKSSV